MANDPIQPTQSSDYAIFIVYPYALFLWSSVSLALSYTSGFIS